MTVAFGWTRTDAAIPTWDLNEDPMFYVEKWGMGSYAVYRGEDRTGEPGTYGTRDEAQHAAETAYLAGQHVSPSGDYELDSLIRAYRIGALDDEGVALLREELEGSTS